MRKTRHGTLATLALLARLGGGLLHAGQIAEDVARLDDYTLDLAEYTSELGEYREQQETTAVVWAALNQPRPTWIRGRTC